MVHEVAADLVGGVGEALRIASIGGAQQQHRRLHGAGRQDHQLAAQTVLLAAIADSSDGLDPACRPAQFPAASTRAPVCSLTFAMAAAPSDSAAVSASILPSSVLRMRVPRRLRLGEPACRYRRRAAANRDAGRCASASRARRRSAARPAPAETDRAANGAARSDPRPAAPRTWYISSAWPYQGSSSS